MLISHFLRRTIALIFLMLTVYWPALANPTAQQAHNRRRLVGYYTQWSLYKRQFFVKDIALADPDRALTHLLYAFGNIRNNRCEVGVTEATNTSTGAGGDAFADYVKPFNGQQTIDGQADSKTQPLRGNWNQLRKLKAQRPGLKILISLGGWSWSGGFASAAQPNNRREFVRSCIQAYIQGNLPQIDGAGGQAAALGVFDGIDIDWEYPGFCTLTCGSPADRANYTALLKEFRQQLDAIRPGLLLTTAVGAGIDKIERTDPDQYARYVDFINVMTYDFHGSRDKRTNHHSPLFASPDDPSTGVEQFYNSHDAILAFLRQAVPPHKLNLGIGFYGHGWTHVADMNHGLYQPGTGIKTASYKDLKQKTAPLFFDPQTGGLWSYDGNDFWSYDNPLSIRAKMDYVRAFGLGGAFFWEMSQDNQGELLHAIKTGLDRSNRYEGAPSPI